MIFENTANSKMTRSSHRRCFIIKGVLRNFAKFTWKHLCQCLYINEVVDLMPATLLKKKLLHRCFSVNFLKFLETPFLQNTSGRLRLNDPFYILISKFDLNCFRSIFSFQVSSSFCCSVSENFLTHSLITQ